MNARVESSGGTGRLVVEGVVTQASPDAWEVELVLELEGERDTRVLRGTTCEEVAQAAVCLDGEGIPGPAGQCSASPEGGIEVEIFGA